jgi:hypothetical protein
VALDWVVISSSADVLIASTLSVAGIAMTPLPIAAILGTLTGELAVEICKHSFT